MNASAATVAAGATGKIVSVRIAVKDLSEGNQPLSFFVHVYKYTEIPGIYIKIEEVQG